MATFYINSDTGSDSTGDGSEGNPWETLAHAHDQAAGGDTIVCQDATATYAFVNQTFTKSLTVQGEQEDGDGAVFDGGGNFDLAWKIDDVGGIDVALKRMTIQNLERTKSVFSFEAHASLVPESSWSLENVSVSAEMDIQFSWNGVFGTASNLFDSPVSLSLTNCLFNLTNYAAGGGSGIKMFGGRNLGLLTLTLAGCTVYYATGGFRIEDYDLPGSFARDIKNCIFYSVDAISWGDGDGDGVTYCDLFNVSAGGVGTGVITSDPLFVDPANDNFNLRPDSPCISTGTLI